ncbi:organic hydroperoxide resistance protein [Allosphingosinicella deserti]|uniref:Peroxiredoxin n=1 Tax=Allosphingosinicella deserti TaxID=2116704 RepID=A0A2P7QZR9_9SPHN|nr:organic hydroperoxide resistance protein [Sphingomonas deserti]PSJ43460.1 peroxiredoxin [Sphingomonas deserti]
MSKIDKLLYTGRVRTTGGREGASRADDGRLDVRLSHPGAAGSGTNPEQLLAAGWSGCFLSAIQISGKQLRIAVPADLSVDAEIDLVTNENGYQLSARLNVSLPGVTPEDARKLVEAAHETCPYSKATRGNVPVELNLI